MLTVNIALGKTSWLSPGQEADWKPSFATDGLEGGTNCAYTTQGDNPAWVVDLERPFLVSSIWFALPSSGFGELIPLNQTFFSQKYLNSTCL